MIFRAIEKINGVTTNVGFFNQFEDAVNSCPLVTTDLDNITITNQKDKDFEVRLDLNSFSFTSKCIKPEQSYSFIVEEAFSFGYDKIYYLELWEKSVEGIHSLGILDVYAPDSDYLKAIYSNPFECIEYGVDDMSTVVGPRFYVIRSIEVK